MSGQGDGKETRIERQGREGFKKGSVVSSCDTRCWLLLQLSFYSSSSITNL